MSDENPTPRKSAIKTCTICGKKPADPRFQPFCSARCADVDLNRWLKGAYAIPVTELDDEDGDNPVSGGDRSGQ